MFTGIIEGLGLVRALKKGGLLRLTVESELFKKERVGDSISVNGVCLTITDIKNNLAEFDIMPETAQRSNLSGLKKEEMVNLERALRAGDGLNGHIVSGHVDCVGGITGAGSGLKNYFLTTRIQREDMKYIVPKGSVCVDGVSLTIAETGADNFTVYLIPHTLKNSNLQFKKRGDLVNIEFDVVGKYIVNLAERETKKPLITEDFLKRHGF